MGLELLLSGLSLAGEFLLLLGAGQGLELLPR